MNHKAKILQTDEPTANGNIYTSKAIKEALEKAQEHVKFKRMFVYNGDRYLDRCCGVVNSLELEDNNLVVEIELFPGHPVEKIKNVQFKPVMEGRIMEGGVVEDLSISYISIEEGQNV